MILRLDRVAIDLPRPSNPSPNSAAAVQELLGGKFGEMDEAGLHQILYRFSPDDYRLISQIWQGSHPEDGSPLRVVDGPPEGFAPPDLDDEPQLTAPVGPDLDPAFLKDVARKVFG